MILKAFGLCEEVDLDNASCDNISFAEFRIILATRGGEVFASALLFYRGRALRGELSPRLVVDCGV